MRALKSELKKAVAELNLMGRKLELKKAEAQVNLKEAEAELKKARAELKTGQFGSGGVGDGSDGPFKFRGSGGGGRQWHQHVSRNSPTKKEVFSISTKVVSSAGGSTSLTRRLSTFDLQTTINLSHVHCCILNIRLIFF